MTYYTDISSMVRRNWANIVILVIFCVIYFYPYIVNHNYIVAAAHGDDDLYAYNNVINNMSYFNKDIFYLLVPCFVNGTLLTWGALWLVNTIGIPISIVNLSLEAFMFFALPFCYVFLLRKSVDRVWLPLVFLIALLSHHYAWNLSNHGMTDLPYRPHIAIPFLFGGIMLILGEKKIGYFVAAFGVLFHAPMGIYAFTVITIWLLVTYRKQSLKHIPFLSPLVLAILVPAYVMLSHEYPPVSWEDLIKLYSFNMHFLPWNSPWGWQGSVTSSLALLALFILSRRQARRLGQGYERLVFSSFYATILMSCSHLLGLAFDVPFLINICGLRSITFFGVILLPVIILYLVDAITNGETHDIILAAFILLTMVIGRPFGLFLFPIGLLLIVNVMESFTVRRAKEISWVISAIFFLWLSGWLIFKKSPGAWILDKLSVSGDITVWNSVYSIIGDSSPSIPAVIVALLGFALILMVVVIRLVLVNHKQIVPVKVYACTLILIVSTFLIFSSYEDFKRTGNQSAVDLYSAQIWAKENTKPNDLFIVFPESWRSFSARPTFSPAVLGYYVYLPDRRIKDFDDKVFEFYGLNDPYSHYNQRSLMLEISNKYNALNENDFRRLARYVEATYLVETRKLNLPIAYSNSTYYIYKLM